MATGFYRCLPCGFDFTVRTNTVMERSKVPLYVWCAAMLSIARNPEIPSANLAAELPVSQKTAWLLLQRIHAACGEMFERQTVAGASILAEWSAAPEELARIADVVLNYRPKPKSKASRKRAKKAAKKGKGKPLCLLNNSQFLERRYFYADENTDR